MSNYYLKTTCFSILCLTILMSACSMRSPETNYYILNSGETTPIALDNLNNAEQMPKLQLRNIDLPQYLDRNSIVTRDADGVRLTLANFESWAESLDNGTKRVVAEVLTPLLLEKDILLQPLDDDSIDPWQIFIQVHRFDGTIGQSVVLDARWTVRDSQDETLTSGAFVEKAPAGADYQSLVQAHSTLLKKMAQSMIDPIANALK